jgi:predicted nuclease of predicted toxin-antitoxin system
VSKRVARALRELGFKITWIGANDPGVPTTGSSDETVVDFARQTNQVIVTKNHDMMTLCDEAGQRFVWIDPRGKQLSLPQQVLLVFGQIDQWQEILKADSAVCVRALRTGARPIASAEAARLARNRMRRLQRRTRNKTSPRKRSTGAELGVL